MPVNNSIDISLAIDLYVLFFWYMFLNETCYIDYVNYYIIYISGLRESYIWYKMIIIA